MKVKGNPKLFIIVNVVQAEFFLLSSDLIFTAEFIIKSRQ